MQPIKALTTRKYSTSMCRSRATVPAILPLLAALTAGLFALTLRAPALAQPTPKSQASDSIRTNTSPSLAAGPSTVAAMFGRHREDGLVVKNICRHDVFIFVDGVEVGEVRDGYEARFRVLPGSHHLEAKEARTRSRGDANVVLVAHETLTWTVYDAS